MSYFENKLLSLRDRLKDRFGDDASIKELSLPKSGCTLQAVPFLFEQLIEILNDLLNHLDDIHQRPSLILPDDHKGLDDTSNNTKYVVRDVRKLSLKETKAKKKPKRKPSKYSDLPKKMGQCVIQYLNGDQLWNSMISYNLLFAHGKSVIMKDPSLKEWYLDDPLIISKLIYLSEHVEVAFTVQILTIKRSKIKIFPNNVFGYFTAKEEKVYKKLLRIFQNINSLRIGPVGFSNYTNKNSVAALLSHSSKSLRSVSFVYPAGWLERSGGCTEAKKSICSTIFNAVSNITYIYFYNEDDDEAVSYSVKE